MKTTNVTLKHLALFSLVFRTQKYFQHNHQFTMKTTNQKPLVLVKYLLLLMQFKT